MSIAKPQTASLIDILNQGFVAVNRRIWVIVIPIILNIYVWYGAQVSFRPLINDLLALFQHSTPAAEAAPMQAIYAGWRVVGAYDLTQTLDRLRLVPRLALYSVPAATGGVFPSEVLPQLDPARVVFEVGNPSVAVLLFLAVNLLLVPISAAFLAMLANAVRQDRLTVRGMLALVARTTLSILGYAAMLLAALLVIGVPVLIVSGLLMLASPGFGLFLLLLLLTAWFWLNIYIGFSPEAIAVGQLDPIQALRSSFQLVRRHFWGSMLLLLLSAVISAGLGLVWSIIVQSQIGLVVAIIGSAYVGSGLVAARMIFYRERLQRV